MISRHANIIKRHRNPVGIFPRVLIYLLIGVGAWRPRLDLVAAEAALEAMLWTAELPVGETFGFVEDTIEKDLGWLSAPSGSQTTLSFVLLALYSVAVFTGL